MRKKTFLKLMEYQTEQSARHLDEVRSIHKEMRGYKHDFHNHLQTLKSHIEVEDTASIVCSGNNKFTFFATNGGCCDFPVSIVIKTDTEVVNVLRGKVVTGNAVYDFDKDTKVYGKCCYGTGHLGLFRDFYDCVKNDRRFDIDGKEASKVIKLILSAYESMGETIKI